MTRIVVGIDGTERGDDAVVFARRIAERINAGLTLVLAYRAGDRLGRASRGHDELRRNARALLADVRRQHAPEATIAAVASTSPAHALREVASRHSTPQIVVGSARHSRVGRIAPGTTGERLLHGAPCPVAVVPHGYAITSANRFKHIGVGIDGTPESSAALAAAGELALQLGADLELIRAYAPGGLALDPELRDGLMAPARRDLAHALAAVPPGVTAHPALLEEAPARALAERSQALDLLVLGSRGHGPARSVALGGVSGRLIRRAACPVIVVPRESNSPVGPGSPSVASTVPGQAGRA
jgi:nucleotide-binding universal stress UspA family protein